MGPRGGVGEGGRGCLTPARSEIDRLLQFRRLLLWHRWWDCCANGMRFVLSHPVPKQGERVGQPAPGLPLSPSSSAVETPFIQGLLWVWRGFWTQRKICAKRVSKIAQTRRIAPGRLNFSCKKRQKWRAFTMHRLTTFAHRRNRDGTYDSICTQCYATVASASNEEALSSPESAHACDRMAPYLANPGSTHESMFMLGQVRGDSISEPMNPDRPATRDFPCEQNCD